MKATRTIELGEYLALSSNANYFNYMHTLVNENTKLGRDYLNFDPTTTTITIPAEFIETLGKGEHKVEMVFAQGRAETTFIVE